MNNTIISMNNIIRNCKTLHLGVLFLAFNIASAQDNTGGSQNYNTASEVNSHIKLPKSPEADAFEKYGNTPVNLCSGTPNIEIPLHTFKGRELDISMSLSYDASGVKMTQVATNAGLGWNLILGGRISRIAVGRPDDMGTSPYAISDEILAYTQGNGEINNLDYFLGFMRDVTSGLYDTQMDLYSLNLPGLNDYIVFDLSTHTPRTLLNPRIQVTQFSQERWLITGEDGTRYYFEYQKEVTNLTVGSDLSGVSYSGDSTTSWLLTKIISKNGFDTYDFDYKTYTWATGFKMQWNSIGGQLKLVCPVNHLDLDASWDLGKDYKTTQLMPFTIKRNTEVLAEFKYKSRGDLTFLSSPYQGGNAIDEIVFYDYKTSPTAPSYFKRIKFNHSYFGFEMSSNYKEKRLKLDSVNFYNTDISGAKTYSFEYDRPQLVPSIDSNSQDFMGLYNGQYNASLIPRTEFEGFWVGNANRTFDFDKETIGTLSRITYPTKGYTDFTYETNKIAANHDYAAGTNTFQEDVFKIDPTLNYFCTDNPDQFHVRHPSMISSGFSCIYGNPNPILIGAVATTLMTIDQTQDYFLEKSGDAIYMIQKITGCDNPVVDHYHDDCQSYDSDYGEVDLNYYPCLRPTNSLYLTWPDAAHSSQPQDYIVGGCTRDEGSPVLLHNLPAGNYQVTMWLFNLVDPEYGNNETVHPSIRIYKEVVNPYPAGTAYLSKEIEGFRVKSIKDYSYDGSLAGSKEYRYATDLIHPGNSSGVQLSVTPAPKINQTKYLGCIPGSNGASQCVYYPHINVSSIGLSNSPNVGYASVFEISNDGNEITNGYTQSQFYTGLSGIIYPENEGVTSFVPNFRNGKISSKTVFDKFMNPRSIEKTSYAQDEFYSDESFTYFQNSTATYAYSHGDDLQFAEGDCATNQVGNPTPAPIGPPDFSTFPEVTWHENALGKYSYHPVLQTLNGAYGYVTGKATTTFPVSGGEINQTETYEYDTFPTFQLLTKSTSTSDGIIQENYTYNENYPANPEKISDVVTSSNGVELFHRHNEFLDFGTSANLLTEISTSKAGQTLETRLKFYYDPISLQLTNVLRNTGNPNPANSDYDCYVYGYNDLFPIAKIQGMNYNNISGPLLSSVHTKSQMPVTDANDALLRNALKDMRDNYPKALFTTYTFNPNIGVTSQTDSSGKTTFYHYDQLGRLETVRDDQNFIVSENLYHYKN